MRQNVGWVDETIVGWMDGWMDGWGKCELDDPRVHVVRSPNYK
jgi:hypothetical protein